MNTTAGDGTVPLRVRITLASTFIIVLGSLVPSFVSLVFRSNPSVTFTQHFRDAFSPAANLTLWGIHSIPAIILAYIVGTRMAIGAKQHSSRSETYQITCACGLALIFAAWFNYAITTSDSSTASIGYVFLPFWTVVVMMVGVGLGKLIHWLTLP